MQAVDILMDPLRINYRLFHEEIYIGLCAGMTLFFAVLAILDRSKEAKKEEPLCPSQKSGDCQRIQDAVFQ